MKNTDFMKKISTKTIVVLSGATSAAFLAFALISQYGFHLHPCELCIAQRVPYTLIVVFAILACFCCSSERAMRRSAFICGLLFLVDMGIAIYHSGVEFGVFTGPSGCTNNDKPGASIEEMRAAIMNAQLVPCDQPMAYIFGLSMASWYALAAMGMAALVFYLLKNSRRALHA